MKKILIVDDEPKLRKLLQLILSEIDTLPLTASDGEKALKIIAEEDPDIVITDLKMPGMNGMDLLKTIKKKFPEKQVIIITAYGSIDSAVAAMKEGAADYITKPFEVEDIKIKVKNLLRYIDAEKKVSYFFEEFKKGHEFNDIIGESPSLKEAILLAQKVAHTSTPVLLMGESGTGKELFARAIHLSSPRSRGPFIALNCASIPDTLLESELFGYEKGAFTGAYEKRKGKLEIASGGTLFLDEIGEMPYPLQAKLLRVLEEKQFYPLGSTKPIKVDFRLITATNKDLELTVKEGNFREDLFYRINVFTIKLPPLRNRGNDIINLAQFFIKKFSRELGKKPPVITDEVKEIFLKYPWKGNVRELQNVIERACIVADDKISLSHLPPEFVEAGIISENDYKQLEKFSLPPEGINLDELEKKLITEALQKSNYNVSKAARLLGLSRPTLRYRIEKYRIPLKGNN